MKDVFKREIANTMTDLILANATSTLEKISMAKRMKINRLFLPAKHAESDFPPHVEKSISLESIDRRGPNRRLTI